MKRSNEMRHLQGDERTMVRGEAVVEGRGLVEWAVKLVRGWRGREDGQRRQMRLVETLPLGGKRQLILVSCDGERFLVGGGLDSIETIVRVKAESSLGLVMKNADEICG
jgi:flagellar biogenesis protein FliO